MATVPINRPKRPKTFQVSLRIDDTVEARTARIVDKLLAEQPALRAVLPTLGAQLRVVIDRGLAAFEDEHKLPPLTVEPPAPRKTAKKR